MRVLAVGAGAKEVAEQLFDDATVDYAPTKPSKQQTGYDAILLMHVLQRVSFRDWRNSLGMFLDKLRAGGELHIFSPSLEWAAEQILSEKPSPLLMRHLFGNQGNSEEFHISGMTLHTLRELLASMGVAVQFSRDGEYALAHDGEEYVARHHYVMGKKAK